MTQRFDYLDAMRGFAILSVILTHAASVTNLTGLAHHLADFGGYGVQLFFVVSAFTIFLTYERSSAKESKPVRNFFIRRLMRIVPVYWFGIVLYTAVYGMASRGWLPGPEYWHYPMHVFLVNLLHPASESSVVPGGWSISCEVLFYLTVPLWFACIQSIRAACFFTLAAFLLGPQCVKLLGHVINPLFSGMTPGELDMYWYRSLPSQLGCFAIGILLYMVVRDLPTWARYCREKGWNLLVIGIALALVLLATMAQLPVVRPHHVMAMAFGLLGLALSQIPWRLLVNGFTVWVGRVSYSSYLLHFLVLKQLTLRWPPGHLSSLAYFGKILGMGLALTLLLAWISYHVIEKTFVALGRRWIDTLEHAALPLDTTGRPGLSPRASEQR